MFTNENNSSCRKKIYEIHLKYLKNIILQRQFINALIGREQVLRSGAGATFDWMFFDNSKVI